MKCALCNARTSRGKKPMCATVCPSGALYYGPREYVEKHRQEKPLNEFQFGRQTVRTKVNMMAAPTIQALSVDVADFLPTQNVFDNVLSLAGRGSFVAAVASLPGE